MCILLAPTLSQYDIGRPCPLRFFYRDEAAVLKVAGADALRLGNTEAAEVACHRAIELLDQLLE